MTELKRTIVREAPTPGVKRRHISSTDIGLYLIFSLPIVALVLVGAMEIASLMGFKADLNGSARGAQTTSMLANGEQARRRTGVF